MSLFARHISHSSSHRTLFSPRPRRQGRKACRYHGFSRLLKMLFERIEDADDFKRGAENIMPCRLVFETSDFPLFYYFLISDFRCAMHLTRYLISFFFTISRYDINASFGKPALYHTAFSLSSHSLLFSFADRRLLCQFSLLKICNFRHDILACPDTRIS